MVLPTLRAVASYLLLGLSLVAFAQDSQSVTLKPFTTVKISAPVHFNTKDQKVQIHPLKPAGSLLSENEHVPPTRAGVQNNLPVGGLMDHTVGSKPKISFEGIGFNAGWPPDCDFAVGPNNVVVVVNTAVAFYSRTGTKQFQANLTGDDFFSGIGVNGDVISDPRVTYDAATGHWFVHIIEVNFVSGSEASHQLIAVSDGQDPNGGWKKYRIDSKITVGGAAFWLDYPGVGLNRDGYVFTGNMFGFAGGFTGAIFTIPKSKLIDGTAKSATVFVDNDAATIMPSRTYESNSDTLYCLSTYSTSQLKIHAIKGLTGTPTVTSTKIDVTPFATPTRDAVGPDGHMMDGFGDSRMFTSAYRSGSIVGAHNIMSSDGSQIGSRWYEIKTNGWPDSSMPTLRQSGNIFGNPGEDTHMPAVAINKSGAMAVIFTRSSSSLEAQLDYCARKASDPLNQIGKIQKLTDSPAHSGPQPANRWGDYFRTVVDPNNEFLFWGFGELSQANNLWTTWVNNWKIADPTDYKAFTISSATVYQGVYAGGAVGNLATADGKTLDIRSSFQPNQGDVSGALVTLQAPTTPDLLDDTQGTIVAIASAGVTMQVFGLDANDKPILILATAMTGKTTVSLNNDQIAPYLRADGTIKLIVRGIVSRRLNKKGYVFRLDQTGFAGLPK